MIDDTETVRSMRGNATVTFDAHGYNLESVQSLGSALRPNKDAVMPYGMFDFRVTGLPPGAIATVDMTLPTNASPSGYFKQDPKTHAISRFDFNGQTGAIVNGNRITLGR